MSSIYSAGSLSLIPPVNFRVAVPRTGAWSVVPLGLMELMTGSRQSRVADAPGTTETGRGDAMNTP
jgi:hypothetical protein